MKNVVLVVAAWLLPLVVAYAERGVAERMLYYLAYKCEEETKLVDPSYQYKVAPGCETGKGRRCTMDELLVYIWAEKTDGAHPDTTRPTGMSKGTGINPDLKGFNFNQFEAKVRDARFNTGATVDGNVDHAKLWPGAVSYYDALSKMGGPINDFSKAVMAKKAADSSFKPGYRVPMWKLAKDCADFVAALRRKNLDKWRAEFFRDKLSAGDKFGSFEPVFTNYQTAKKDGTGAMDIPVIDWQATIDKYKSTVPDIENILKSTNTDFLAKKKTVGGVDKLVNMDHMKAVVSAGNVVSHAQCSPGLPRELKKKRSISLPKDVRPMYQIDPEKVHYGGKKAAKSRKLKAQRLAEMGVHLPGLNLPTGTL